MVVDFTGKTAVVTGGTGGIGTVICKEFLESGADVVILDVKQDVIDAKVSELSAYGRVAGYEINLGDSSSIAPIVEKVCREFGGIDVLVNCAGIMGGSPGLEVTVDEFDRFYDINARGLFFMMQQVVEQSMKEKGGSIVNFASMAAIRGMHPPMCSAPYSAAKGAVVSLTMQAAVEWASLGVRVNAVAPGGVLTGPMATQTPPPDIIDPIPMKKLNRPEDIANGVLFLSSDCAATITGQTLVIDGGASVVGY
ncbi:MAG: glucose 1-dehydrogenase [Eubacterium sp.]|nr:glucose 1-dehydrogenase [Eubacterium sp.]